MLDIAIGMRATSGRYCDWTRLERREPLANTGICEKLGHVRSDPKLEVRPQ